MQIAEVLKLNLCTDGNAFLSFDKSAYQYMLACDFISQYVFDHDFCTDTEKNGKALYSILRSQFGLKSQMAQSALRTVSARYKSVNTQMKDDPYIFKADDGKTYSFSRDITWLKKPIHFHRPQIDLVRSRDYSFVSKGTMLSINTLDGRVKVPFKAPKYMHKFLDGTWRFGTAKLVCAKGRWYLHISATKDVSDFQRSDVTDVVGLDRGLRFIATGYDSEGKTTFFSGKDIMQKRKKFDAVRRQLQAKGTKSAKRVLKRLSGRENRWMSDKNHCISKTLVRRYGSGALFVLEDLKGVSFDEQNNKVRGRQRRHDLHNWSFYDLETKLSYKTAEAGSRVIKVDPHYTSQRCPHCGAIIKENRDHAKHLYTCRQCGFRSNDDRVGAMNLQFLGTMWVTGDDKPSFATTKVLFQEDMASVDID